MPSYASPTKFHKPFSNLIYLGIDFVNIKFTLNWLKSNAEWKKDAKVPSCKIGDELVADILLSILK
jgi:hypothetical protein